MNYLTKEEGWLCHVIPVDCASVCYSFGDGKKRYEAIISKQGQSRNHCDDGIRYSHCSTASASAVSSGVDSSNIFSLQQSFGPVKEEEDTPTLGDEPGQTPDEDQYPTVGQIKCNSMVEDLQESLRLPKQNNLSLRKSMEDPINNQIGKLESLRQLR